MWYVYGASMFFSVKNMRKKKTIHWNCMGMLQTNPFSYPLKWTMEMANYIIVMKLIVYIYIYIFIKISTHKIGNISHGPAIPSSEPQVSISSSMRPPGVGRPWPISCRCWRDFSCLGQLGNPQMKYYIWRVLMCFNRNIHGKSTIN